MREYIIGVDEAGRGALAGPVCVGAVLMPHDFDWREAFTLITKRGEVRLRDSKQLSAAQREILYEYIVRSGVLKYGSALVDAAVIDERGIAHAIREAAVAAVHALGASSSSVKVLLDAGLALPKEWSQEAFVRGDENIPVIALASMIAKVSRDRRMVTLASTYPHYGFEVHKGYGTAAHLRSIREHGMTHQHRRTFIHL